MANYRDRERSRRSRQHNDESRRYGGNRYGNTGGTDSGYRDRDRYSGRSSFDGGRDSERRFSGMYPDRDRDRSDDYFGGGRLSPGYGQGYSGGGDVEDLSITDTYGGSYDSDRWSGEFGGYERSSGQYGGAGRGRATGDYGRRSSGGYHSGPYSGRDREGYESDYPRNDSWFRDSGRDREEERGWWDRTTDEVASWFGDDEAERRREMDRRRDEHRGRGPRNYSRSDDRILEDVNDRLTDSPFIDASDIEVEVSDAEVTLTGTVDSRYAKRMAEDIAESVSGIKNVENRIRYNDRRWNRRNESFDSDSMNTSSSSTARQQEATSPGTASGGGASATRTKSAGSDR